MTDPKRSPASLPVEQQYGRKARQSLEDILDLAADAADLVGRSRRMYDSDRMLQLAGEAITGRIGEAASRLPEILIAEHPEIPFRSAKSMRNFVTHDYDRVDTAVVWVALESDIPTFAGLVAALLRG